MPTLPLQPLRGTRILSLALNLPGPAALMRCRDMGATCIKLEPPAPAGTPSPGAPGGSARKRAPSSRFSKAPLLKLKSPRTLKSPALYYILHSTLAGAALFLVVDLIAKRRAEHAEGAGFRKIQGTGREIHRRQGQG